VTRDVDLATMPIYVRAGAIVPVDPVRQYTSQPVSEPTTLRVYRGADGEYTLYEDDGISQAYLQGRGTWTRMVWDDAARRLTLEPGAPDGATNVPVNRTFRVLVLPEGTSKDVTYSGRRVQIEF
jgi:alpha-glucosidase/alpha-D-xyloside xylohydrolase